MTPGDHVQQELSGAQFPAGPSRHDLDAVLDLLPLALLDSNAEGAGAINVSSAARAVVPLGEPRARVVTLRMRNRRPRALVTRT